MSSGVERRSYLQVALLAAMIPAEVTTMLNWSAPIGAVLLGGTVAATATSELGPRV